MQQPRLGHINFINCLPLDHGLVQGGFGQDLVVVPAVPAVLNRLVHKGELDVSPVSSIMYATHTDKLLVLPNISISAAEAVKSILLVAKRPMDQLDGGTLALTAKSATSHGLLKIIMHYACRVTPNCFISSRSLEEGVLDDAEAALFIGDEALVAYYHRDERYYYYDLGVEWRKLTGHVMVYALWVVNIDFARRDPKAVQLIYERIRDGFRYGLIHLDEAIATTIGKTPISNEQIRDYIGLLDYRLEDKQIQALTTYYRLAQDIGLIRKVPRLDFAEVQV